MTEDEKKKFKDMLTKAFDESKKVETTKATYDKKYDELKKNLDN